MDRERTGTLGGRCSGDLQGADRQTGRYLGMWLESRQVEREGRKNGRERTGGSDSSDDVIDVQRGRGRGRWERTKIGQQIRVTEVDRQIGGQGLREMRTQLGIITKVIKMTEKVWNGLELKMDCTKS